MNIGVKKKIVFFEDDKKHADMKIRLKYDGLTQQRFFESIVDAYVCDDVDIISFVDKLKERDKIHSKKKRKDTVKLRKASKETKQKFALEQDDIESIFDIIEKENTEI
tara:strand:- start:1 stop:324 length:324 start_codon:yes stop_codon:yes gene_type:complete